MDHRRPNTRLLLISFSFALLFFIAFWAEFMAVINYLFHSIQIVLPYLPFKLLNSEVYKYISQQNAILWTEDVRRGFAYLGVNCVIGVFTFAAMVIWMAEFVLPVRRMDERFRAVKRLFLYLIGLHGPAIFVKEGKIVSDTRERKGKNPGVALVDSKSAIVMETFAPVHGKIYDPNSGEEVEDEESARRKIRKCFEIHAEGPGLVFTEFSQQVHGAVDLRTQFRITPKIDAYTRDGIKVESSVFSVFSLCEEPDTIFITYVGDISHCELENFRVVHIEKRFNNDGRVTEEVTGLFKLSPDDAFDVLENFKKLDFRSNRSEAIKVASTTRQPYPFDADRATRAIYYLPHTADGKKAVDWTELPNMVAIEMFRNTVAQYTYDYMHMPGDPVEFPLKKIKQEFSFQVRSKGVMKYQIVFRHDGQPIMEGQRWSKEAIHFSPELQFRTSQPLREKGIKVIVSGFSELMPPDSVRDELINSWRARWEKEINSKLAKHDLEAARIRNRARVQAQQDTSSVLSDVFSDEPFSEEALTVRVFQALETASTDISESRLLPHDTINMLWSLYQWMLRDEEKPKDTTAFPEDSLPGGLP